MNYPRFTKPSTPEERDEFLPFLKRLADAALKVILPNFLAGIRVDEKSNHTPVTLADRGAESAMRRMIEENYPQHGIYGEELGIKEAFGPFPRYRWILDPIDGTRAFISNSFHFGNLIALERGKLVFAEADGLGRHFHLFVLAHEVERAFQGHAPHRGEDDVLVLAGGAQVGELLHRNALGITSENPMKVRECNRVEDATLLVTSHWTTSEQVGDSRMQTLIDRAKLYRTWGDCFGYFAVASGGADIMIDPDLNYWDVAALVPVIEGSGARLVSSKGGNPLKDLSAVATNEYLLPAVLRKLAN